MARKMLKDGEAPAIADGGEESYDYDLFVIGAGSGGVRGSRTAAGFGAKVCAPPPLASPPRPPHPAVRYSAEIRLVEILR